MTPEVAHGRLRKRDSHLWKRDPLDYYIEPRWCSERLFATETFTGAVWDSACGSGRIVEAAQSAGILAMASDIENRHPERGRVWVNRRDFLDFDPAWDLPDNIVSNPPFGIAERFVAHALKLARGKVAMLLPTKWIQGDKRSRWLATTPLRRVLFLAPRPSMPPGAVIEAGESPGGGKEDYAWFIWEIGYRGPWEGGWLRRDV